MNLTVRIHEKEYPIAQGATFSEEYNETLDSGAIRIPRVVGQIDNLRPYDDVYIYESGYDFNEYIALWRQGGNLHDGDKDENGKPYDVTNSNAKRIPFYRHLLVNQYTEEVVNLDTIDPETKKKGILSYSIELFSETKGLEMVQVPNCSVTQPLNIKKKTDIYTYLCRFVDLYSPKHKTVDRSSTSTQKKWTYAKKYSVSPELKKIFGGVYSQDFTLSNPTLRDVLSTLMITKDMIPYVKDGVIYAKAISERTDTYDIETEKNSGRINLVVGQMSSADYCDGVRRQYSDALSQDGICHYIEHLGFRNKDNSLMTIDNMQLETTHKIYRIKKLHMCYYKKVKIYKKDNLGSHRDVWFLCKQDITPLIKLDSEWNLLSQDWSDLDSNPIKSIDDLSQYKLTTVYYSMGGNTIQGWGTRYNKYKDGVLAAYDITQTYIENILYKVDALNPFGISGLFELDKYKKDDEAILVEYYESLSELLDSLYAPHSFPASLPGGASFNNVIKLKTLFFEIEYSGFYDGALIHSRDKGNDNLFQNDNQSSSLTLLEKDGFSQKEKLNRFANKTYTMKGRLDGPNYGVDNLLELGQTGQIGEDDDVIIYRREYSIYDNYILASYAGIQDYVLKNFYTSVYAKYRTNQLMSYGESTNRAETQKVMLLLSKNKKFKDEDTFLTINNDKHENITNSKLFSAFVPNSTNQAIDSATILLTDIINENGSRTKRLPYKVDQQTFTSGNSLCFNIAMTDNASGGNYIDKWVSKFEFLNNQPSEYEDYYAGSTQLWHNIVDNDETGAIEQMGFVLSHVEETLPVVAEMDENTASTEVGAVYSYTEKLPTWDQKLTENFQVTNEIVVQMDKLYKDNKEKIDMTLQVEPISTAQNDIVFSDLFMRLSDLVSYYKYDTDGEVSISKIIAPSTGKNPIVFNLVPTTINNAVSIRLASSEMRNLLEYSYGAEIPFDMNLEYSAEDISFKINAKTIRPYLFRHAGTGEYQFAIELSGEIDKGYATVSSMIFSYVADGYYESNFFGTGNDLGNGATWTGYCGEKVTLAQTITKNMFVEYNTSEFIDKTFVYKTLPNDIDDGIFMDDNQNYYNVSQCFKLFGQADDSYIRVYVPSESVKSVRYWYFDFDAAYSKDYTDSNYAYKETPQKSSYKFVFGVNINNKDEIKQEPDSGKYYVDIYITKTTHRDPRIFDSLGRQVGMIHNCVTQNGYIAPDVQEYDNSGHNIPLYVVSASVEPSGSGEVVGESIYYKGEEATIEFIPNDGNIFYRWKENGETIKSNPISFVVDKDRSLIAQCGVNYNIWKDNLGIGPLVTRESDVELYKVNREEIAGDILKISATNLEVTTTGSIPLTYSGSFSIDPNVNVSKDTASKAIVLLDAGTVTLKTWFENDKIMFNGYRTYFWEKQPIVVNAPILNIVLVNNPEYGTITLDFSDENIESISYEYYVETDVPGVSNLYSGTIAREEATDNKYIIENVPYGSKVNLWAATSDMENYIPIYSKENPKSSVLGLTIIFKPKSKQITREILWESTDGIELTYDYDTSGILNMPRTVVLDGLENYLDSGKGKSTQYMQFVFDVDGNEKSIIIDHMGNPIAISDEITFASWGLVGAALDENSDVVDTGLFYVLLTTGATQPTVKLKKIFAPLTE